MKLIKEIKSKTGDLHFQRFLLFRIPLVCSVVIHIIYRADEDEHLHNHPWNFFNIILYGSYTEMFKKNGVILQRLKTPYKWYYTNRKVFHKVLEIHQNPIISLNVLFGKRKDWGYDVDDTFVDFKTYRKRKHKDEW